MDTVFEESFADRLSELRSQYGISAREMSLSLGQNPGYINNIENRKSLPSMAAFFDICDYLGISPEEFFMRKKNNELNAQIGKRIAVIRREKDFRQDVLAKKVGVTTQYISNLERGIVGVSTETLMKLCEALEVSADYVLFGADKEAGKSGRIELGKLSQNELSKVSDALNILLSNGQTA